VLVFVKQDPAFPQFITLSGEEGSIVLRSCGRSKSAAGMFELARRSWLLLTCRSAYRGVNFSRTLAAELPNVSLGALQLDELFTEIRVRVWLQEQRMRR